MEQTVSIRKKVLVVEDKPGIAKLCLRTLSEEGFQVDIAVNGWVALEMWKRKDYDLCISDIRIPRMNGIELFRQLATECPEAVNKFIFTTGDILNGNIKIFLEETMRPCLPKPFAPENLRALVKTALVAI